MKKAMIAVVNTPGAASGTITLRNACHVVAPSTCAACSISQGISRKKADMVQMEMGRVRDRYGMISPIQVSYSPICRHRLNSGVTMEMTGKIATPSAVPRMSFFPGKSSRAMAYAANIDSTHEMNVAIRQIPNEFRSAGKNRSLAGPVMIAEEVPQAAPLRREPPVGQSRG